jgi:NADH-quinone oxidoreductase subunit K
MISLWHFLVVGAVLFGLGLIGFLTRRNLITMFLCAELMLQGVVLNLVAFGRYHGTLHGQVFGLFIVTVAACEAGVALALFLTLYRIGKSLDSGDWQSVRETGVPPALDIDPMPELSTVEELPKLPIPGRLPHHPSANFTESSRA